MENLLVTPSVQKLRSLALHKVESTEYTRKDPYSFLEIFAWNQYQHILPGAMDLFNRFGHNCSKDIMVRVDANNPIHAQIYHRGILVGHSTVNPDYNIVTHLEDDTV